MPPDRQNVRPVALPHNRFINPENGETNAMTTNGNETPEQPEQPHEMESVPPEPQSGGQQSSGGLFGIPTKLLVIGGGGGGIVLVIVIVAVLLFVTGVIGGGNPQPQSILDLAPDDAESIVRIDLERVLENDLLAEKFDAEEDVERFEDPLGVDPENLSQLLLLTKDGVETVVLKGAFDLDDIRDELEDAEVEKDSYRGYEVWDNNSGLLVAMFDEYLVFGDEDQVETVLKNLYNEARTLERTDEDNEMKQVLDKVGAGYLVYAATGDDACSAVDNCDGYGWAVTEVDESDEEAVVEIALLFSSERRAERAADDYDQVADFLERVDDLDIDDTESDGVFVIGQAILDLEEEESRGTNAPRVPAVQTAAQLPAAAPTSVASVPRGDWVNDCYDYHPHLERDECGCVFDELAQQARRNDLGTVPSWFELNDNEYFLWLDPYYSAVEYCS